MTYVGSFNIHNSIRVFIVGSFSKNYCMTHHNMTEHISVTVKNSLFLKNDLRFTVIHVPED